MNKEDEILIKNTEARLHQCEQQSILTHTNFLDMRQSTMLENIFRNSKHLFYGGYEDAERRILIFLPDYLNEIPDDENPIEILRVSYSKGSKELTHRDFLGSILSLGIDRNVTGDIIINENKADIIILKSMEEFLLNNYSAAGRISLNSEIHSISECIQNNNIITEKKGTVASLRLDNIVSEAFNLSRSKAQEAIKSGLVYVNNLQDTKTDHPVYTGEKIVLRGSGKAILKETGKETKKGRIPICFEIYKKK